MPEITPKQKQELQELVSLLGSIKGMHTELVTVLIPAGTNIYQVSNQLSAEASTAANIKSKQTRTSVVTALEMIIRELKEYRQTPPNGLALFCGNVSEKEGGQDIQIWAYQPPKPLNVRIYRCDKVFVIEPLKEMLEVDEVFGLLVIDRQAATIGLLEGKQIKVIRTFTSGVPGKVRAGGQCLSPDTLIMKDNGEIIKIKDSHNPLLIVSENFNIEKTEETPVIAKWENDKELFKITTKYPKLQIKASKDHSFFVRTENGIEEKPLSEIKIGDYLIMPEKINLTMIKEQEINFTPIIQQAWNMKKINIPKTLDNTFAKILGYYLGDGNYEIDRISFSEQREELAKNYKNLIDNYFGVNAVVRFRENKGYYQIRVGSRILSQLFRSIFQKDDKTLNEEIPSIILKSPDNVLASFIKGFFDAEGYISSNRVGLGINNEKIIKQLQLLLLRFGIVSSVLEYNNRRNPYSKKPRFTIVIDDGKSLSIFKERIGFSAHDKSQKLDLALKNRSKGSNVRQLVVNGKEVARILRNSGLTTHQFKCPSFFVNERQLSKEIFKSKILDKIENEELKRRLELFYLSNLNIAKISKIESVGTQKTVDIETKNHNFVANGLVVHNSAARYSRVTEGLAKEFFRRVAEGMKEIFFDMPKLKGILIGGPIPTKEDFIDEGDLVTKLKEKIIAVKDVGYTDEHGLELLVEQSWEDIAQQELIKEKKILTTFFDALGKKREKTTYGYEKTKAALERGAVELLLISDKLPKEQIKMLEALALLSGTEVVIIGTENQDGDQFLNLTKGAGAILRFQIDFD